MGDDPMNELERFPRTPNRLRALFLFCGGVALVAMSLMIAGCRGRHSGSYGFDDGSDYRDGSGVVRVSKMGGDIDVEDAPGGAVLSTMGGVIRLKDDGSYATLKTMGGNIDIGKADGAIDATTMGGNIRILAAGDSVHSTTMGGNLSVRLVPSAVKTRNIDLSTMGGQVELIVPKDFPMEIDVELAYTRENGHKPSITEPFGLTHTESSDWDYSHGSPRKYLYAKGKVGAGGNRVTIKGIAGDVTIVQE